VTCLVRTNLTYSKSSATMQANPGRASPPLS
jgi:hypothetical protein